MKQFEGFTQGPWSVAKKGASERPYVVASTGNYGPNVVGGEPANCAAYFIGDEKACEANGALIQAAPALLKQLQAVESQRDALLAALRGALVFLQSYGLEDHQEALNLEAAIALCEQPPAAESE